MPGAGSLTAANYMYNVAPKDGTVISTTDSTMPFYNLWEGNNSKFDPLRLNWLGSIANQLSICIAWHTSSFKTLDDIMQRPMRNRLDRRHDAAGNAAAPLQLRRGLKFNRAGLFLRGVFLAMERGEFDGTCSPTTRCWRPSTIGCRTSR